MIIQVLSVEYIFFHSRSSFFSKSEVKLILPQVFHAFHFKNPKRKREKKNKTVSTSTPSPCNLENSSKSPALKEPSKILFRVQSGHTFLEGWKRPGGVRAKGSRQKTANGFNFASISGQTTYPEIGWVGLPSRG